MLYTDGKTVWDANHQPMPNGSGLMGDDSSTQSGIVVPKPGDLDIYYVFTVDDGFSSPSSDGMRYSVVDMTLNGGMGDVVTNQKNIPLVNQAGEKVTAVKADNDNDVWVLTFAPRTDANATNAPYQTYGSNFNTFYAFKVTQSGINIEAVISMLPINISGGVGYMKASPDGTKIAIANMYDGSAYILDFDNVTGEVSNPVALNLFGNDSPYGVEFSPDSSKLYISDKNNRLIQFDLNNNNSPTIISTNQNYRSALQLAHDGKIYQPHTTAYGSGTNTMSVIENPNELGTACNYRYRFINLNSGMECHQGLPPFIQSYFTQISNLNVTANVLNTLEVITNTPISSVDWDFGDGTTDVSYPDNPPDNTHSETEHLYDQPGTYTIEVIIHLVLGCDIVITKVINIPESRSDYYYCGSNNGLPTFDMHIFDAEIINLQNTSGPFEIHYYHTRDDAINDINELPNSYTLTSSDEQIYYVVVDTVNNISVIGLFNIIQNVSPVINPNLTDYEICDSDTDGFAVFDLSTKIPEILGNQTNPPYEVHFYPTQTDAEGNANEITNITDYTNQTPDQETIWYRILDTDSGCCSISSFDLIVHPLPEIIMDDEYILCEGQNIQIDAPVGFVTYEWSTGETSQSIDVNTPGTYTLTVTDTNGCQNEKTITVILSNAAVIELVDIKDFIGVNGNSITVFVNGVGDYEYSLDGINYQESNTFTGLYPGTYTIYVSDKNGCGVVQKEVDLLGAPQFFTPNGDGNNDHWQIINVTKRKGTYVYIYDRYGKLMAKIDSNGPGWDGMYNGRPALATDYWFAAQVKEDDGVYREVKGHFSLKR
jgi:gliding motility-associated-like protein